MNVFSLQNQCIDATSLMSRIMQRTGNPSIEVFPNRKRKVATVSYIQPLYPSSFC